MIDHIVLFKFKESTSVDEIKLMEKHLKSLRNQIPEILSLSTGKNFSTRNQGFDHGLVVRFHTAEDLEIYQKHPAHTEVLESWIRPIILETLAVDYSFDD